MTWIPLQTERTAGFITHAYTVKGTHSLAKGNTQFSLRAKYELDRLPENRNSLMKEWENKGKLRPYSGMRAHLIAERLVAIEFLRRKEGDLRLLYGTSEDKFPPTTELQMQTKRILKDLEAHVAQDREHVKQEEISL